MWGNRCCPLDAIVVHMVAVCDDGGFNLGSRIGEDGAGLKVEQFHFPFRLGRVEARPLQKRAEVCMRAAKSIRQRLKPR
jgi:hypothetical protein